MPKSVSLPDPYISALQKYSLYLDYRMQPRTAFIILPDRAEKANLGDLLKLCLETLAALAGDSNV